MSGVSSVSPGLPLAGLRVLAVEQYGAGPFCTQHLADIGAEVIKIENPSTGGDYARYVGPHFIQGANQDDNSASVFFQSLNRNKRSIGLNIQTLAGKQVFHRLIASADAVIHNLRGDVPAKLGLRYDDLAPINAALVCAHLTGYGRDNKRESWPGFDFLMQAEAGYFSVTGEPDSPPTRMGLSIVDYMAGVTMALGLVAGVMQARQSGIGRDVDVNLFDTALYNLSYLSGWYLNNGHAQGREPRSGHPSITPCALYKTADSWIFIMCNKEKFWPVLCAILGHEEWSQNDPRFSNFQARHDNKALVTKLLERALAKNTTQQWMALFAGQVPAAPVCDVAQALDNPFVHERGRVQTMPHDSGGEVSLLATPIELANTHMPAKSAPALGLDTYALMTELGYSGSDISTMLTDGIIACSEQSTNDN